MHLRDRIEPSDQTHLHSFGWALPETDETCPKVATFKFIEKAHATISFFTPDDAEVLFLFSM